MAQGDDGRGFGQSVALHDEVAEVGPELLDIGRKRRAAGNEAPEFPSEHAMNAAESPPAQRPMPASLRCGGGFREAMHHEIAQHFEDFRHGDHRGNFSRLDLPSDLLRAGSGHEDDGNGNQRRDEQRERLTEQMAQRKKIQDAQRLEWSGVFLILGDLARDGLQIRQQVAMGDDDAFRLGRGAGGEDDFGDVAGLNEGGRKRLGSGGMFDFAEQPRAAEEVRNALAEQDDFRLGFLGDAVEKIFRRLRIDGNHDDAVEQARPQRGDPTGAAFRPNDGGVAFRDSMLAKPGAQRGGHAGDVPISVRPAAKAIVVNDELGVHVRGAFQKIDELRDALLLSSCYNPDISK